MCATVFDIVLEWNGMESMECIAVEWNGMDAFWVILVILGRFVYFWLFCLSFVGKTNATSEKTKRHSAQRIRLVLNV